MTNLRYAAVRFFSKKSIAQAQASGYTVNHGDLFQYAPLRAILDKHQLTAIKYLALAYAVPRAHLTMWSNTRYLIEDALSQDVNRIAFYTRPSTKIGALTCSSALLDPVQVTELVEILYDQLQQTIESFGDQRKFMSVPLDDWRAVSKTHMRRAINAIVAAVPRVASTSPYIAAVVLLDEACAEGRAVSYNHGTV